MIMISLIIITSEKSRSFDCILASASYLDINRPAIADPKRFLKADVFRAFTLEPRGFLLSVLNQAG